MAPFGLGRIVRIRIEAKQDDPRGSKTVDMMGRDNCPKRKSTNDSTRRELRKDIAVCLDRPVLQGNCPSAPGRHIQRIQECIENHGGA